MPDLWTVQLKTNDLLVHSMMFATVTSCDVQFDGYI